MAEMIVLCGEDNAPSFLIDVTTKKITRYSQGLLFSDDVGNLHDEGDYIWAADLDSNLVCWTKDLVNVARRDLGWYAQTQRGKWVSFHINGDFLYVLNTHQYDGATNNAYDVANERQLVIRKFNKVTLQQVAETVLDDPLFWDDATKEPLLDTRGYFWAGNFLWICTPGYDWYKVDISTGVLTDTWTSAAGSPQWIPVWANADGSKALKQTQWTDTTIESANFVEKTVNVTALDLPTAASGSFDPTSDVRIGSGAAFTGSSTNRPIIDEVTNTIHFIVDTTNLETWGTPHFFAASVNWMTGALTISAGLELAVTAPDADKMPQGMSPPVTDFYSNFLMMSPTKAFMFRANGAAFIDFSAGTQEGMVLDSIQTYANNGVFFRTSRLIEIPAIQVSGQVLLATGNTPVANQLMFLYDQATGQKMDETLTDSSGNYTFTKYTTRPYFVVCSAPDQNANFKIKARL